MERLSGGRTAQCAEGSRSAAANDRCSSRSEATALPEYQIRSLTFSDQGCERWNIGIPLDECRHGAEARDRQSIKLPHLVADLRAVVVDECRAVSRVTGKMNFSDHPCGQPCNERARVE